MEKRSTSLRVSAAGTGKASRLVRDISESLGKLPPQAPEMEEAVLGELMLEKGAAERMGPFREILTSDHFYYESHKLIYAAIQALWAQNLPVDMRTVINQLRITGHLEIIGGAHTIANLTGKVSSSDNISSHIAPIIAASKKRDLIQLGSMIHQQGYEDECDPTELIETVKKGLLSIEGQASISHLVSIKEGLYQMVLDIQARSAEGFKLTGIPSGFQGLDKITSGWQPSDLILVAARPGMGKTALMLSLVRNAAVAFGIPCGILSMEMATIQLVRRLSSMESELPLKKLRSEKFQDFEMQQLTHKTSKLAGAPIWINDQSALSITKLQSIARQMKLQFGIKLLVVDYIQLMKGSGIKGQNREQEISEISRGLKEIAKELNIPVIALSQLSRAVETRGKTFIPQLSDLRESGSLEQDADIVSFLWRPEYYKITSDSDGEFVQGLTKLIIAKHRNGSLIDAFLQFIGKTTEFKDAEHVYLHSAGAMPPDNFKPLHDVEMKVIVRNDDVPF